MQPTKIENILSSFHRRFEETFTNNCVYEFGTHTDSITQLIISPNSQYIISASEDSSIKIWRLDNQSLVHHFHHAHKHNPVEHIAITPDSKILLSAGTDKRIIYWDLENMKFIGEINLKDVYVASMAISKNGFYFVIGLDDQAINVWDLPNRTLLYEAKDAHKNENPDESNPDVDIKCVRISPDSEFVVSCSMDKSIKIWKLRNLELVYTFKNVHKEGITTIAISDDGNYLVSGSEDKSLKLWNFNTRELIHHFTKAHGSEVLCIAISSDSKSMITGADDAVAKIWSLETHEKLSELKTFQENGIAAVAISPDRSYYLTGAKDNTINIWASDFGFLIHEFKGAHDDSVLFANYMSDGKKIISVSKDKSLKVWDTETKDCVHHEASLHRSAVTAVAVSNSGNFILTASADKTIKTWEIQDKLVNLGTIEKAHLNPVLWIAFSPDDDNFITCSKDKSIKIWNFNSRELLHTIENAHNDQINCVTYTNKEATWFLSASSDKSIKLWSNKSKQVIFHFQGAHNSIVHRLAVSHDNSCFLSSSEDSIKLWSLETKRIIKTLVTVDETPLKLLAFSPDQKYILGSCSEYDIGVWSYQTLNKIAELDKMGDDSLCSVSISPNSENFVCGCLDKNFKIWPLTKKSLNTKITEAHSKDISSVVISADGKYIITVSDDQLVKVWSLETKKLVKTYLHEPLEELFNVAISCDSKYLIASTIEKKIKIWDFESDNLLHVMISPHGNEYISYIEFTPDGEDFLSSGGDGSLILWNVDTRKMLHNFGKIHFHEIMGISLSIDGKLMATGSRDKSIKLFDFERRLLIHHFVEAHAQDITAVKISADRKFMVSSSGDKDIKMWSLETCQQLHHFTDIYPYKPKHLLISRNCQFLVSGSTDQPVKIWSTQSKQIFEIPLNSSDSFLYGLAISPDGRYLVGADNKDLYIWNLPSFLVISKDFSVNFALTPNFENSCTALPYNWNEYHYKIIKKTKFDLDKACQDDAFCLLDFQGRLPIDYINTPDTLKVFNIDSHKAFAYKLKCAERLREINYNGYLKVMESLSPHFISILKSEAPSNPKNVASFLKLCYSPDTEDEQRQVAYGHTQQAYGETLDNFVECRYPVINQENQKELTKPHEEDPTKEVKIQKLKYNRTVMPLHLTVTSRDTRNLLSFLHLQSRRFFFEDEFINMVLDYLWERTKFYQIILFMIYSTFMIFVSVETCYSDSPLEWMQIVVLAMAASLFVYEMGQNLLNGIDLWNALDIICYSLVITTMGLLLSGSTDGVIPYLKTIYLFAGYFRWMAYLRIADGMRSLIRTIIEIFKDMSYFLLILFFTIMAYSCVLESFNYGDEESRYLLSLHKSYLFLYDSTLDPEPVDGLKAITVLFPLIINVVFLNMLISIMGDTYDKIQEKKTYADNQERVNMILEIVQSAEKARHIWRDVMSCCGRRKQAMKQYMTTKMFTMRFDMSSEALDVEFPVPETEMEPEKRPFCLIRCENESEDVEEDWDGKLNFLLKKNIEAINDSKVEIQNSMNTIIEQKLSASQDQMKKMIEIAIGDVIEAKIKAFMNDKISVLENKIDKISINGELPNITEEFLESGDQPSNRPIKINALNVNLDKTK